MSSLNIINQISNLTSNAPSIAHGFATGQEVIGNVGIEVDKKFIQAINSPTLENIVTSKQHIPLSVSLYGEIKYRVEYGNGFSTMPIPNGNEIGNYIFKQLVRVTLDFPLGNRYLINHDLTRASTIARTIIDSAGQMGVSQALVNVMPKKLKSIMSSLQQRVAHLNSNVANAIAVSKNLNDILGKSQATTNYVNDALQFFQDAIDNNYTFTININGRIYKNLMISTHSGIRGTTKYDKFCECQIIFQEIDVSNLDTKKSLLRT